MRHLLIFMAVLFTVTCSAQVTIGSLPTYSGTDLNTGWIPVSVGSQTFKVSPSMLASAGAFNLHDVTNAGNTTTNNISIGGSLRITGGGTLSVIFGDATNDRQLYRNGNDLMWQYGSGLNAKVWHAGNLTINDILPTQTGNSGKLLTTNGSTASWVSASSALSGTIPKQYIAHIDQSGTSAPTVQGVVKNDLGTVTYNYISTGRYSVTVALTTPVSANNSTVWYERILVEIQEGYGSPSWSANISGVSGSVISGNLTEITFEIYTYGLSGGAWVLSNNAIPGGTSGVGRILKVSLY